MTSLTNSQKESVQDHQGPHKKKVKIICGWNLSQKPVFLHKLDEQHLQVENQKIPLYCFKSLHKSCSSSLYTHRNNRKISPKQKNFRLTQRSHHHKEPYKIGEQRSLYKELHKYFNKLKSLIESNEHQLSLNQLLNFKKNHIDEFLQSFISKISLKNKNQALVLTDIFNFLFQISEMSLEKLTKQLFRNQIEGMREITNLHKSYQERIEQNLTDLKKKKNEIEDKNRFMKILVQKLKQYKKEMRKMDECLKIASQKVNQFKQGFIEAQIECIDLMMESRNISHENAKAMLNKKIMLQIERHKKIKVRAPKATKKERKQKENAKKEIQENKKIMNQFYEAFQSNLHEKTQNIQIIVGTLIDTILDGNHSFEKDKYDVFAEQLVKKDEIDTQFTEYGTDMDGFQIFKHDRKVGIGPSDRFIEHMTKMRGVQTISPEKSPPKRYANFDIQCEFKEILKNRFQIIRTMNMDFLFENTNKIRVGQKNFSFPEVMLDHNFQRRQRRQKTYSPEYSNEVKIIKEPRRRNDSMREMTSEEDQRKNKFEEKELISQKQVDQLSSDCQSRGSSILLDSVEVIEAKNKKKRKNRPTFQRRGSQSRESPFINSETYTEFKNSLKRIEEREGNIKKKRKKSSLIEYESPKIEIRINDEKTNKENSRTTKTKNKRKNKVSIFQPLDKKQVTQNNYLKVPIGLPPTQNDIIDGDYAHNIENNVENTKRGKNRETSAEEKHKKNISKGSSPKEALKKDKKQTPISPKNHQGSKEKDPHANKINLVQRHKMRYQQPTASRQGSRRSLISDNKEKISKQMLDELYKSIEEELRQCKNTNKIEIQKNNLNQRVITTATKHLEGVLQSIEIDLGKQNEEQINIINLPSVLSYLFIVVKQSYGVINNAHLCKKVKSFVKDIFILRKNSHILDLFIFSLGFKESGERLQYSSSFTTMLWYKILRIVTVKSEKVFRFTEIALKSQSLEEIIQMVGKSLMLQENITEKLYESVVNNLKNGEYVSHKANSFSEAISISNKEIGALLKFINQFIYDKYSTILASYECLLMLISHNLEYEQNLSSTIVFQGRKSHQHFQSLRAPKTFLQTIILLNFFPKPKQQLILQNLDRLFQQSSLLQSISWSNFGLFCLQNGIYDLCRLSYKALGIFKLTQNQINPQYLNNNMKMIQNLDLPQKLKDTLFSLYQQSHKCEIGSSMLMQTQKSIKSVNILLYLKLVEQRCELIVDDCLGENLSLMHHHYGQLSESN